MVAIITCYHVIVVTPASYHDRAAEGVRKNNYPRKLNFPGPADDRTEEEVGIKVPQYPTLL